MSVAEVLLQICIARAASSKTFSLNPVQVAKEVGQKLGHNVYRLAISKALQRLEDSGRLIVVSRGEPTESTVYRLPGVTGEAGEAGEAN